MTNVNALKVVLSPKAIVFFFLNMEAVLIPLNRNRVPLYFFFTFPFSHDLEFVFCLKLFQI